MKMCNAFAQNGHDVMLIVPDVRRSKVGRVEDVYEYYGVSPCFRLAQLRWLPMRGRGHLYALFAARYAGSFQADIVYSRNVVAAFFATVLFRLRSVFEAHTPARDIGLPSFVVYLVYVRLRRALGLVVISEALRRTYVRRQRSLRVPVIVAHDGADAPSGFVGTVELGTDPLRTQVGYVGSLLPGKGARLVAELALRMPDMDFHIVGGGSIEIDALRRDFPTVTNLYCHGHVPHAKIQGYIKALDVVLLPNQKRVMAGSDIGRWTSPLKAFEYMALARPIVCSDVPVLKEIFQDRQTALFCPPESIHSWAEAVRKLDIDKKLARTLSKNAYNQFVRHYTWTQRSRLILSNILALEPGDLSA